MGSKQPQTTDGQAHGGNVGAFVQLTYKPQFHFTSQAWEEIRAMDSRPCWWTWERMIEKTTVTWRTNP